MAEVDPTIERRRRRTSLRAVMRGVVEEVLEGKTVNEDDLTRKRRRDGGIPGYKLNGQPTNARKLPPTRGRLSTIAEEQRGASK